MKAPDEFVAHTVSICPTQGRIHDSAVSASTYLLLHVPPTRRTKFGVNSGMRFTQFNKYVHSIKIIFFLLGEVPHQVLYRCFTQISEQTCGFKVENMRLKGDA